MSRLPSCLSLSRAPFRLAVCGPVLLGVAGCDHFDVREAAGHLPPYQHTMDRPKTIIDAALERCPDKTEEQETSCVKEALGHLGVASLVAAIPDCRLGKLCLYRHKTDDRLGYVPAMAEDFVVRWKVGIDLRKAQTVAEAPVTVEVE